MSMRVALLSALAATVLISCQNRSNQVENNQQQNGIIGGDRAVASTPERLSTVSFLRDYFGPRSFCSGTLISKNLVLTASHCLQSFQAENIAVFFGDTLPTTYADPNIVRVKVLKVHPDYHSGTLPETGSYTGFNDIGLVLLEKDAPAWTRPALVMNPSTLPEGMMLTLAGFGLLEDTPKPVEAPGLFVTHVSLAKVYNHILVTDQTQNKGACSGDSGGPAYVSSEQGLIVLGITRGPHGDARDCHHYGEYTYASLFKEYILATAQEFGATAPVFADLPAQ